MNPSWRSALLFVILAFLQFACSDEQAEIITAAHIETHAIDGLEQMLLEGCSDGWCKPYAREAAESCVSKHLDVVLLMDERPTDVEAFLEPIIDDIHFCAIGEMQEKYNEAYTQGT